jgi:hypothetical protein
MANFRNGTELDLDEASRHFLLNASNQLEAQVISSESSCLPLGTLDKPMAIAGFWEPTFFVPFIADAEITPPMPGCGLLHDGVSSYTNILAEAQDILHLNSAPHIQQSASASAAPKRAPKAPTISSKSWEPYERRIRELYVHGGRSIEELREIINTESGFTAK